jgi:predicted amidohydrolase
VSPPELVAVQHEHPDEPRKDVPAILDEAADSVAEGGIAVLPEYFYRSTGEPISADIADEATFVADAVREASGSTEGAIVATVPEIDGEEVYNTALVTQDGDVVLRQRKLLPTEGERERGVSAGQRLSTATIQGLELGVLVCADVLSLDLLARMARQGPDVVAVPVVSPNRESDRTQQARTSVFVARAWDLGAYVVKAGGYREPDVVGRSLLTAPWGVEARAGDPFADARLSSGYQGDRLAEARRPFDPLREPAGGSP